MRLPWLYAQPNHACMDMREIMIRAYDHQPLTIFDVPCRVEVFGDVEMLQLQHWLSRAAVLRIRNAEYGNGPGETLAMPAIHWAEMKRVNNQ